MTSAPVSLAGPSVDAMSNGRKWLAVAVVVASVMVAVIDGQILNLALPALVRELDATTSQLQWIVDAYILVFAGAMLTAGSLADRFGRVRLMRIGMAIFGIGSLAASLANSPAQLIAARALMGVGAAIISPATLSIVTSLFTEPAERSKAIGVWAGGSMTGIAIGPILGGLLLSHFWWGSVFLVNIPIVLVSIPLLKLLVPESKNPAASRLDPIGMITSTAGLALVLWATISAPDHGWTSAPILIAYSAGAMVFVAFIAWERHAPMPVLDVGFFTKRQFVIPTVASAIVMFTAAAFGFVLAQLLQFVHGYTPLEAGVRLVPMAVVLAGGSIVAARVAVRIGPRRMIVWGICLEGAACIVLGLTGPDASYFPLLVGTLVYALGQAMSFSPLVGMAMQAVPAERTGVASGTTNTARQVGTALGVAVTGSVLASVYRQRLADRISSLALDADAVGKADDSVGGALKVAGTVGGESGRALAAAARSSYVDGAERGLLLNAGLCALAALAVAVVTSPRRTSPGRR